MVQVQSTDQCELGDLHAVRAARRDVTPFLLSRSPKPELTALRDGFVPISPAG